MDPEFYNSRYRVHTSIQLQRSNKFDIYEVNAESTLAATTEWTRRFLQPTRLVQAFLLLGVLVFAALNLSYVPLLSSIELQAAEVHDLVWRKNPQSVLLWIRPVQHFSSKRRPALCRLITDVAWKERGLARSTSM
jgi:hypothetical protein